MSVLASHVPHDGMRVHPLWVCSSHPLWVRSFHPLWVHSFHFFFILVLVKAAETFSSFSSVRRALHDALMALRAASWRTVRSHTFLHVLRVASWPDQHHFVSSSLLCVHFLLTSRSLRAFCLGLWGCAPAKAESSRLPSRDRHSCSFRQPPLCWPRASWSVGTSRLRHGLY